MGKLSYKTVSANRKTVTKDWVLIDASDISLGRTASVVAGLLRGKHKSNFTPHVDCGDNVVIINHGEYYTLYAKLKNLKVQKGDLISEKQVIADLVTNNDGITQLQFQIFWVKKLNPLILIIMNLGHMILNGMD